MLSLGKVFLYKRMAILGLFFFIFIFSKQLTVNVQYNFLLMTGFELRTTGTGSNRSTNWATTTAHIRSLSFLKNGPTPASFSFIFGLFKQTSLQFLQQIIFYRIQPVTPHRPFYRRSKWEVKVNAFTSPHKFCVWMRPGACSFTLLWNYEQIYSQNLAIM